MNKHDQEIIEAAYKKLKDLMWVVAGSRQFANVLKAMSLDERLDIRNSSGFGVYVKVSDLREYLLKVLQERADAAEIELEKMEFPSKSERENQCVLRGCSDRITK